MPISFIATIVIAEQSISSYYQSNLRDLSFTAKVLSSKAGELGKINQDFAKSYRFKASNVWLKEPMKLRMESRVEDTDIYFIVNGGIKLLRIPRAKINQRDDVSKAPGKRQTPLDFGLLTPSLFNGFLLSKFIRTESSGDLRGCPVFDLTYQPKLDDSSRYRVWVDPVKKFTRQREWYSQAGFLMATFVYDQPKEVNGVWIPGRATVKNADGKFAGATEYANVKVNTGLAESLFKVD
ncbi:MAG: outer membrane lipoprotein-sorting protein [Chthonomonadaceae bacterium]|nr:outer membrane lipoprotein-sorting protein [Chthonomonadaceae bacterium]